MVAGLVGLAEDLRGVPIGRRLVVHLFVGLTLVSIMPFDRPVWRVVVGAVVLILVVVAVINAVNFMDGINGISAATGLVGGLAYAAIGSSAHDHSLVILGAAVAAASAAFAPWNVPRARVFLGDVGSYALGAALAGCLVVAVRAGQPLEAAVGPLALYFADTGTVLARRLARREPWREPHRLHAYQRLTNTGLSHAAVSAAVLVCTAAVSGLGLVSLGDRFPSRLFADLLAVVLIAGYLVSPSLRRAAVQA